MKLSSFNKSLLENSNYQVQEDFQTTIQFQFDYVARKVMIRTQRNYRRSIGRRRKHECLFSEISDFELNKLRIFDTYNLDRRTYKVLSLNVEVTDCQIAKTLDALPERKRDIILMFYYLEMSDAEIAEELGVNRSTVYRNRANALEIIKKLLEGEL
ncbi:sigma-70 family RNA polymerase sigma factor [Clostridium tyrobutyricum]|jgi:RNA polymerase sigma factor (sigma-70 family)|uniref:sigma-70 family RNA polymerase sigma factor n=1 Tax=Clostridium tyrobutyricum TaxID=1519 RepID=UPI0002EF9236|nr:sigma-70 family RNA polymerase sigma factor [Clostridium tyrobutyricum]MEA5009770.1 sigma-70 family RNA polymerase sigma factor [Clostridium tyrobutyricum]